MQASTGGSALDCGFGPKGLTAAPPFNAALPIKMVTIMIHSRTSELGKDTQSRASWYVLELLPDLELTYIASLAAFLDQLINDTSTPLAQQDD